MCDHPLRPPLSLLAAAMAAAVACGGEQRPRTDFTTEDSTASSRFGEVGRSTPPVNGAGGASAPAGRTAAVEEGDIYRVAGTHLYYLNTYRGFVIYDLADPARPARLSRLPVHGYPVEMYVEGTTVFALLRDALYLTQVNGRLEFQRRQVSQLVAIDVSNPASPRILKTLDIVGELREGVSRKIENTIYVVSYLSRSYYRGWQYQEEADQPREQAWVHSFDVADPRNPRQVGELKVFEGGAVSFRDPATGASYNRSFNGVAISATANALMVAENWNIYAGGGVRPGVPGCGYYDSDQQAVISIIDVSDPGGAIRVHARFETAGWVTDQFKQTYQPGAGNGRALYHGIFARRGWLSADCTGQQRVQNTIETWDVSSGAAPVRTGRLDFGKPNETVRGTAFDLQRKVAFAVTAEVIDPLYAISIADPQRPRVLSAVDGLSGDMAVFRTVGPDRQFLLAIGRDVSQSCTGFDPTRGTTNVAVSIIDARDLGQLRLVQRQCVQIRGADWVSSQVTVNLDQAHKMIGMHQDETANVLSVPVSYWERSTAEEWWYDRQRTAVGLLSWDLGRYDPAKGPAEQTVLRNHGAFVHPNGEVRRSVLFRHPLVGQRMMANLSDTHISLANIQDLDSPRLASIVEVAPYLNELFRFGSYLVEEVQPRAGAGWSWQRGLVEFRVRRAGGELDRAEPVATFSVGQVQRVIKHGEQLVVFRSAAAALRPEVPGGTPEPARSEALVYDLRDPTRPRLAGRVDVPADAFPYYRYYCGGYASGFSWDGFYGGYSWVDTAPGLVLARQTWSQTEKPTGRSKWTLLFLDLRSPEAPALVERALDLPADTYLTALTGDDIDGASFYLGYRTQIGQVQKEGGVTFFQWKDYVARWIFDGGGWTAGHPVNIPGRLIRTWRGAAGNRMLLASDDVARWTTDPTSATPYWRSSSRLSLLREVIEGGRPAAELLDARIFEDVALTSVAAAGEHLFANVSRGLYGFRGVEVAPPAGGGTAVRAITAADGPDRLLAFDLSRGKLTPVYDRSTGMYNVQLMGVHGGRLFMNLPGDGILVADVRDPAKPTAAQFTRTLGYATHVEIVGDEAYVGAGFFGSSRIDLHAPDVIPGR